MKKVNIILELEFDKIRISDELLRNNNIFVSDIIKNDHVKFDVRRNINDV